MPGSPSVKGVQQHYLPTSLCGCKDQIDNSDGALALTNVQIHVNSDDRGGGGGSGDDAMGQFCLEDSRRAL